MHMGHILAHTFNSDLGSLTVRLVDVVSSRLLDSPSQRVRNNFWKRGNGMRRQSYKRRNDAPQPSPVRGNSGHDSIQ